jgi:hypothetical protein
VDEPIQYVTHIYLEMYNESPRIAILNKQKCLFSKMKDRKVKQVLSGCWFQWEGRGYKKRVKEGKYGGNIVYSL